MSVSQYATTSSYDVFSTDESEEHLPAAFVNAHASSMHASEVHGKLRSTLRCILQCTRSEHVSGQPDSLPFASQASLRGVFTKLDLPLSYIQLADGSVASTHFSGKYDTEGRPARLEFISFCLTKQGDWSLALSHDVSNKDTTAFWSVAKSIHIDGLLQEIHCTENLTSHPMLIPCIMFFRILELAIERRKLLKRKLAELESKLREVNTRMTWATKLASEKHLSPQDHTDDNQALFKLLQSCRESQASREGRYHFWQTYHTALEDGLTFLGKSNMDDELSTADASLRRWSSIIWTKLESLQARDKDQVERVNIASEMIYLLVQQQESRTQTRLAKAAQLDSEDMKFIALLGSVFLPAGLVASILNIPTFQFASGANLFAFYLGITAPFIGFVVLLCVIWPRWSRQRARNQ